MYIIFRQILVHLQRIFLPSSFESKRNAPTDIQEVGAGGGRGRVRNEDSKCDRDRGGGGSTIDIVDHDVQYSACIMPSWNMPLLLRNRNGTYPYSVAASRPPLILDPIKYNEHSQSIVDNQLYTINCCCRLPFRLLLCPLSSLRQPSSLLRLYSYSPDPSAPHHLNVHF